MEELWGLSVHPSQNQFVTTGYDKNLYLWDALTHTAVWQKDLLVSILGDYELYIYILFRNGGGGVVLTFIILFSFSLHYNW